MSSQNIQIGIDLGTTNSEIGLNLNGNIEIKKNIRSEEFTPSVLWVDPTKTIVIGKKAYEKYFRDPTLEDINNAKAEVKRLMGTSESVFFSRLSRKMNPEEISAEILKDLISNIKRTNPDIDSSAAVITIPAAFSTLQSEATKRAGNLAGIQHVVLLQEPIAAAVAYGFGKTQNENWLIYDLGGGTFDTALISSQDGTLSVLGHNGDNFLGGKNFDNEIVDKVIIPTLIHNYSFTNFSRSNPAYKTYFHQMKYAAEQGKIQLSNENQTTIEINFKDFCDDTGKKVEEDIPFSRGDLDRLIEPMIDLSIQCCKQTLADVGLPTTSVQKVILVGGPTMMPIVRRKLEQNLGIKVDSSVDPLTIVARGATIYALSQKIPTNLLATSKSESNKTGYAIELFYDGLTSDTEQMVTGVIKELASSTSDHFIQLQSESGDFGGRRVKLNKGKFFDTVTLRRNSTNLFNVFLFDDLANSIPVQPNSFSITQGLGIAGAPLPHSIGLVVAKKDFSSGFELVNTVEKVFQKGSILPLKSKTEVYRTTRQLKKGQTENPLMIQAVEGESDIPDRNTFICELGIDGTDFLYDLPKDSELEITLDIDESRQLTVTAFIPLFDLSYDARSTIRDMIIEVNDLEMELITQKERATELTKGCSPDEKRMINDVISSTESSVNNSRFDDDEKRKASKQLKDIKVSLDKLEKDKSFSQLSDTFYSEMQDANKFLDEFTPDETKPQLTEMLKKIKEEGEKAIANNDKVMLTQINEVLHDFNMQILFNHPATWIYQLEQLSTEEHAFTNPSRAQYLINKGNLALENQDFKEIKECVIELFQLLPESDQSSARNLIAGITR